MSQQDFPSLPSLPTELRLKIWEEALHPRVVTFEPLFPILAGDLTTADNVETLLYEVNHEAQHVARCQHLTIQGRDGRVYRMDPLRDTLRARKMHLPTIARSPAWPLANMNDTALPIQKLHTVAIFWCDPSTPELVLRGRERMEDYRTLPLHWLPLLHEFTMVAQYASSASWLEEYQMMGPEVVNQQPVNNSLWASIRSDSQYARQAAPYFNSRGLRGDAGIRWLESHIPRATILDRVLHRIGPAKNRPAPLDRVLRSFPPTGDHVAWARRVEHEMVRGTPNSWKLQMAALWQWAGSLYMVETKKLLFTPLSWNEVESPVQANRDGIYDGLVELVVKIYIVHPGQTAPNAPDHAWEEVEEYFAGEPTVKTKIRCLWMTTLLHLRDQKSLP
ncbi:Fc.00g037720.m01.CDS01 [Cosmosporella sp. VM-42]